MTDSLKKPKEYREHPGPGFGWEFFPPIAAIVLLGLLAFFNLRNIRLSEINTEQSNRALTSIEQLFRDLLNAETGKRGYLMTGEVEYLEPFHQSRGSYPRHLSEAKKRIDDSETHRLLEEVQELIAHQFEDWSVTIRLRAEGRDDEALDRLMESELRATTIEIRDKLTAAEVAIRDEARESVQQAATAYFNAVLTFAGALVMTLIASIWSLLRVDRELQRRRTSEQVIRQRTGQLQSFADVVARIFSAHDIRSITGIALNEFRQLIGAREAILRLRDGREMRYERGVVATDIQQPTEEYVSCIFEMVDQLADGESTFFRTRDQIHGNEKLTGSPHWGVCSATMDGLITAPLRDPARGEIGRIVLLGKFGEDFTDHDRLLISQLAYSVSVAIDNAKLTGAMEREAARKDQFLAMLGHELRNPLAGVLTGAQALMQLEASDPDVAPLKESILRQSQMMGRIVDDLLDVSRIARGKISLTITDVDLEKMVREILDDYRRNYPRRTFEMHSAAGDRPVIVSGDVTRLSQCLSNLLHNACKFSPVDAPITVRLALDTGKRPTAVIDIIDRGVGLSAAEQDIICDPFHQAHATIDRSQGGLGIGLTLVKGLIEMHGGRLSVTSEGHERGSTFTVQLPLKPEASERPHREKQDVSDASGSTEFAKPLHTGNGRKKLAASAADRKPEDGLSGADRSPSRQRVLVIDDRMDAILPIRVMLKREGHEVFEAYDGPGGVSTAIELCPDLILCDIGLPGKWNGYDVVRELRKHPKTREAFIVALSGYSQPADRRRAEEAGFNLHLAKPIDRNRLRQLMNSPRDAASA